MAEHPTGMLALDRSLGELVRRSLLDFDQTTYHYRFHDLLRDVARQRCSAALSDIAYEHHATYFCQLSNMANHMYQHGGDTLLAGLALFDAALPHILAGHSWAAGRAGAEHLASKYALGSEYILSNRLPARSYIVWLEGARAAAQADNDPINEGKALSILGIMHQALSEPARAIAYYEQWLAVARTIGDRRSEAYALNNLGESYISVGEVTRAVGLSIQSLVRMREIGDRIGEGAALGVLGRG
jgi:tetratricopeptide (TPR) repeat protein